MMKESSITDTQTEACINCGSNQGTTLFSANDFDQGTETYQIYRCQQCLLSQTKPFPSQEQLANAYDQTYYGTEESKFAYLIEHWALYSAKRRASHLLELYGNTSESLRILDIGCGRGVLLKAFKSLGHNVVGVERKDSPFKSNPDIICDELDSIDFEEGSFDIVVLWHVLEHLEEPGKTLKTITKLLNKNGSLFVSVPNFGSFQASLFKGSWFHLDLPRHLYHFNEQSVEKLLSNTNLQITSKETFSFDQNTFGFIQSTLNTLPFIKSNHFYNLLKSGLGIKPLLQILCYSLLAFPLFLAAIIELISTSVSSSGASLNLQIRKTKND